MSSNEGVRRAAWTTGLALWMLATIHCSYDPPPRVPADDAGTDASTDTLDSTVADTVTPDSTPASDPSSDAADTSPPTITVEPGQLRPALESLSPGDILELEPGTYPPIRLENLHGEPERPITIRAARDRRATVRADGDRAALRIVDSSHLVIEGIAFQNATDAVDADRADRAMPIHVTGSNHAVLRRNVARHPNLAGDGAALRLGEGTSDCFLVENEVLDFHRLGIDVRTRAGAEATENNVLRRNYINPRATAESDGDWDAHHAIHLRRATDTIVENNIVEYSATLDEDGRNVQNNASDNAFYGNIVIGAKQGVFTRFRRDDQTRAVLEKNLVIEPTQNGLVAQSIAGLEATDNTVVHAGANGLLATDRNGLLPDFSSINNLVVGADRNGYQIRDAQEFELIRIEYSGGWANNPTWGSGTDTREHTPDSRDPNFHDTYVYIPDDSPYAGAGRDGRDIGANILYRYHNGELTDEPLWDPETGEFPHGAVVEGINDDEEGRSAFDVHDRLNVSPATLPNDYPQ